jgi:DNA-binding NarL/FixJ family response regulator
MVRPDPLPSESERSEDSVSPDARTAIPFGLSAREVEVLRLVALGLSNQEIADRLFLSPRTVHHHVSHILNKMGVGGRVEAVRLAMERGVVRPGDTGGD